MMNSSTLLLLLEAFLVHYFLVLVFLSSQRVDGFYLHQPSGLSMSSTQSRSITVASTCASESLLKSSASSMNDIAQYGKFPETNSSLNGNDSESDEEIESAILRLYPWSENQQWALRDNLPKYTIRIPIKQKALFLSTESMDTKTRAKKQEETVLSTFALWRSLQQDVPELSGYPIEVLQARHNKLFEGKKSQIDVSDDIDDTTKRLEPPSTPGVLPFLQDYEFSASGGICGYVYGMDGVSDGSRIETSTVRNIKASLPNGYIQTSDGHTAFELGNPLQTDDRTTEKGTLTRSSTINDLSLEKVSNIATTNELRSMLRSVGDDDGNLLRLGALSGFFLAGATAINMLSHHLTVNVFWV